MPANEKIGIAIQGAGNVSTGHLRAYLNNPACEVVAIGSRTKEGAAAKAREVGLDPNRIALYDDVYALVADARVDALSICSPHTRHAEDTIAAAQAGKHCLVEKPIAMNLDELRAMDAAVQAAGISTVCGFVLRWIPSVTAAVAMREQGLFGELLYVQTDYWHNPEQSGYPDSHNYIRRKVDASAMLLGGCHAVDLARYLMGSDVVAVSALTFTNMDDAPHPPNQVALLHFANGKSGESLGLSGAVGALPVQRRYPGRRGRVSPQPLLQQDPPRRDRLGRVPNDHPGQWRGLDIIHSRARSIISWSASSRGRRATSACAMR